MHTALVIFLVLLTFNLLIFVHELGHFLAAKALGLRVQRFAIWFGRPLLKLRLWDVDFCLGWIPAGGYVSLPQMAPMEAVEGDSGRPDVGHLSPATPTAKAIVAAAGPLFSFGLALVFAAIVSIVGRPVSEAESTTTVGYIDPQSPALAAGLQTGDKILKIDGKPVSKWGGTGDSVVWRTITSENDKIHLRIQRGGEVLNMSSGFIHEKTKAWQRKSFRQLLLMPECSLIIAAICPNSPAFRSGLSPGDRVVGVNGMAIHHPTAFYEYAQQHSGEVLNLSIARNGQKRDVPVRAERPIAPKNAGLLLGMEWADEGLTSLTHPGVWEQINDNIQGLFDTVGALTSRKTDLHAQHLSGAIRIVNIYYLLFLSEHGLKLALWFSVVLNVNLAFLNLLPLPVLDGGHIVMAGIEALAGKPLHPAVLRWVQTGFALALMSFVLYLSFFDLQESTWRRQKQEPTLFAPAANP